MEKSEAIIRLERLRAEAYLLQTTARLGADFQRWHREVLAILDQIYGSHSMEKEEFGRIRFSLGDDMLDSNDERLRTELSEQYGVEPSGPLHNAEGYYQRRLKEAAEFLYALILTLR